MKTKIILIVGCLAVILAFSLPFGLAGCAGGPHGTAGANYDASGNATVNAGLDVTTNVNVGVTGQYNVPTGNWSAGFTITFKDAIPADVVTALANAGGQPVVGRASSRAASTIWRFPGAAAPNDPNLMRAVTAAAGSGTSFTLTPLR